MAIDLVITDLVMPEQEGLETLQRLRAERPELPVIVISGAFGGSFLKTARRFGATATLPKPIDPEDAAACGARCAVRGDVRSLTWARQARHDKDMTQLREHWEGVSLPGDYLLERWTSGDDDRRVF